ncbi:hypothetical protein ACSBR2_019875 [Camellia fascicularis]
MCGCFEFNLSISGSDAGDAVMARWLQSTGLQHLASPLASAGMIIASYLTFSCRYLYISNSLLFLFGYFILSFLWECNSNFCRNMNYMTTFTTIIFATTMFTKCLINCFSI